MSRLVALGGFQHTQENSTVIGPAPYAFEALEPAILPTRSTLKP